MYQSDLETKLRHAARRSERNRRNQIRYKITAADIHNRLAEMDTESDFSEEEENDFV